MILALILTVNFLPTPDLTCRVRNKDGEIVRSSQRRCLFLRMLGYPNCKLPPDKRVNHIVPLRCGGCDVPSNMEIMSVYDWRERTGIERYDCGLHPGGSWEGP